MSNVVQALDCPGWMHQRQEQPTLKGADAATLLKQTAELPGTFRLTALPDGEVVMLGELRVEGVSHLELRIEEDVVTGALESVSLPWKRRDLDWVIPVGGQRQREVVLAPREDGMRIESVLVSWDEIGTTEKEALARFLCRAQASLRFARCELAERQAVVAARLAAGDVETGLPHTVAAVVAAVRLLGREAAALLSVEVAEGYSLFFANQGETPMQRDRI